MRTRAGIGDGQQWPEQQVSFAGLNLTFPNAFSGTDGPAWDDQTLWVSPATLPPGTTNPVLGFGTNGDSLLWTYSALETQEDGMGRPPIHP